MHQLLRVVLVLLHGSFGRQNLRCHWERGHKAVSQVFFRVEFNSKEGWLDACVQAAIEEAGLREVALVLVDVENRKFLAVVLLALVELLFLKTQRVVSLVFNSGVHGSHLSSENPSAWVLQGAFKVCKLGGHHLVASIAQVG